MIHFIHLGVTGYNLKINKYLLLSLKMDFILANNADPGKKAPYAALHPGFHCLSLYLFKPVSHRTRLGTQFPIRYTQVYTG